jgi:hypothetical protein
MTNPYKKVVGLALLMGGFCLSGQAQNDYPNHAQTGQRLRALETAHPNLARVQSLTKTAGGKDIWVLTLGTGKTEQNPALVVVGGVEGSHLLSVELALGFAERLLQASATDSVKRLLATTTFYVFPNMSPDATEQYFAKLRYERSGNATPTDDDRDGRINEDPYEDLNKDGLITWMRVEDPTGTWKKHPADPRIMVKANTDKGEKGTHHLFSEGIDNDKDGLFNEDGEGGIHFNKSLTYDPPYFQPGAGEHPVSELENRALLDFLYERWNVFAVLTFGPANTLSEPLKYDRAKASQRVVTSILEKDAKVNKMVSDLYGKSVKAKDAPSAPPTQGDFMQWAYFHYGRFSYSTPGWWAPKFEVPKDSAQAAKYPKNEDKNIEVDFLRWAEAQGLDVFVPWEGISHPDFVGKRTEVGGFKPFVRSHPPYHMVGKLVEEHTQFAMNLAAMKAQIELQDLQIESVGNGIHRIRLKVHNSGQLPTLAEIAKDNLWLKLVKVTFAPLSKDISLHSGNAIHLLPTLGPNESVEVSWLVSGKGKIRIVVGAPHTGEKDMEINLK